MTSPPDWAVQVPNAPWIHTPPARTFQWQRPDEKQLADLRRQILEWVMQEILLAIRNAFVVGETAFSQLQAWGADINDAVDDLAAMLDGVLGTGHSIEDFVDWLQGVEGDASDAVGKIAALLSGLAQADIAALVTFLSTASSNAADAVSKLGALISGVGGTVIADVVNLINLIQDTIDAIYQAVHNVSTTGHAVSDVLDALGSIFTGFLNALTGGSATSASQDDVNTAVAGTVANTSQNSANILAAQGILAPLPYGAIELLAATIDFSGYPDDADAVTGFTMYQPGWGTLGVISGEMAWSVDTDAPALQTGWARYDTATNTDNQIITVIADQFILGSLLIVGRVNAAKTTYVYAVIDAYASTVSLLVVVAGDLEATLVDAQPYSCLPFGGTYSLVCGTAEGSRYYDIWCNGVSIIGGPVEDTGAASQVGASYRYGAVGMIADVYPLQLQPLTIPMFSLVDNATLLTAPSIPAAAFVATSENTASTGYTDLTTTTDTVTVIIGSSGMAEVSLYSHMEWSSGSGQKGYAAFAVSGASTVAATDSMALVHLWSGTTYISHSATFLLTGLSAGSTTFKMKYRVTGTSSTNFANRRIAVQPL